MAQDNEQLKQDLRNAASQFSSAVTTLQGIEDAINQVITNLSPEAPNWVGPASGACNQAQTQLIGYTSKGKDALQQTSGGLTTLVQGIEEAERQAEEEAKQASLTSTVILVLGVILLPVAGDLAGGELSEEAAGSSAIGKIIHFLQDLDAQVGKLFDQVTALFEKLPELATEIEQAAELPKVEVLSNLGSASHILDEAPGTVGDLPPSTEGSARPSTEITLDAAPKAPLPTSADAPPVQKTDLPVDVPAEKPPETVSPKLQGKRDSGFEDNFLDFKEPHPSQKPQTREDLGISDPQKEITTDQDIQVNRVWTRDNGDGTRTRVEVDDTTGNMRTTDYDSSGNATSVHIMFRENSGDIHSAVYTRATNTMTGVLRDPSGRRVKKIISASKDPGTGNSIFTVSNKETGVIDSTTLNPDGTPFSRVITIPTPTGGTRQILTDADWYVLGDTTFDKDGNITSRSALSPRDVFSKAYRPPTEFRPVPKPWRSEPEPSPVYDPNPNLPTRGGDTGIGSSHNIPPHLQPQITRSFDILTGQRTVREFNPATGVTRTTTYDLVNNPMQVITVTPTPAQGERVVVFDGSGTVLSDTTYNASGQAISGTYAPQGPSGPSTYDPRVDPKGKRKEG